MVRTNSLSKLIILSIFTLGSLGSALFAAPKISVNDLNYSTLTQQGVDHYLANGTYRDSLTNERDLGKSAAAQFEQIPEDTLRYMITKKELCTYLFGALEFKFNKLNTLSESKKTILLDKIEYDFYHNFDVQTRAFAWLIKNRPKLCTPILEKILNEEEYFKTSVFNKRSVLANLTANVIDIVEAPLLQRILENKSVVLYVRFCMMLKRIDRTKLSQEKQEILAASFKKIGFKRK